MDTSKHDDIAWELADAYSESLAEHADPRGVPMFRAEHLHAVRTATSYEDAIRTLHGVLGFIVPKGTAAREAERVLAHRRSVAAAKRNGADSTPATTKSVKRKLMKSGTKRS